MSNSAAEVASRSPADSAPPRRRIARVDGRSKAALRVKAKLASYDARLGPAADAVETAARLTAAELAAVADDLRAARLRGEPVDLNALAKAQGYADRAERALGLDRKRGPAHVPLRERIAAEQRG
jgi:hypothetical protein